MNYVLYRHTRPGAVYVFLLGYSAEPRRKATADTPEQGGVVVERVDCIAIELWHEDDDEPWCEWSVEAGTLRPEIARIAERWVQIHVDLEEAVMTCCERLDERLNRKSKCEF